MAADYTFLDLAREVLGTASHPLSSRELWKAAVAAGLEKKVDSQGKTPWETLGAIIYVKTANSPDGDLIRVGARPTRFWLRKRSLPSGWTTAGPTSGEPTPPPLAKGRASKPGFLEHELHPLLAAFARSRMEAVYVKTVRHVTSAKSTFGEWVHPDVIGVRFPATSLDRTTLDFSRASATGLARLYSFELKRRVDFGNLREVFFQTVSNSSWAHEGYLVAPDWSDEPEFDDELRRLCAAFGIGVIELELEEFDDSRIRIPARGRDEIDWATLDKLVRMNPDVKAFLESVTIDLNARKVHEAEYDHIPASPVDAARALRERA